MADFNFFGSPQHRVFNYRRRLPDASGKNEGKTEPYSPGSYVRGAFRTGNYSRQKGHATKAQNIIGIIGLLLIAVVLYYIAKFYSLL